MDEKGFTLIEVITVVLILAVVLPFGFLLVRLLWNAGSYFLSCH